MNLDPQTLFTVTRSLAVKAGLPTEQLDGIVALGGYTYLKTTNADSPSNASSSSKRSSIGKRNIYSGFNLPNFIDTAFKQLRSDVELVSQVTIGEYTSTLSYTQPSVPVGTDDSLNLLLPILAQPIVQKIVDGAALGISTVVITDPAQNSFGTKLKGNITNAGPFDAKISFGGGLTISWNGKPLPKSISLTASCPFCSAAISNCGKLREKSPMSRKLVKSSIGAETVGS